MILDTIISHFRNTRDTECVNDDESTIGDFLERFRDGEYKTLVEKVRSGDKESKKLLPTIAFHGIFDGYRKKKNFQEASGIIILDIDDIEDDIQEVKEEIVASNDHVLAALTSPSGNGVKVLYYVIPEFVNVDNYREIGKTLVSDFDIYGNVDYLSITDTLIATYDPDIIINENATPDGVYVKEIVKNTTELEPRDETLPLWEDAEDFFETVLYSEIIERTNNNFHFIQVSVLDLAKFGFKHPEHDLSFVVNYAEEEFGYSDKNKSRFLDIARIATDYPQIKWAYKLIDNGEENEEYVDYQDYLEPDVSDCITDEQGNETPKEKSLFIEPNINYYNKVMETAKEGDRVGYEVSFKDLADIIRFKGTGIFTVTGIPGHGKTEMLDAITLDLARLYGHETLIVGFEQAPEEHTIKLMRKLEGRDVRCTTWLNNEKNLGRFKDLFNFVTDKFIHLDTNVTGGNINKILEALAAKISELRKQGKNPKYVVIDPFNMLSIKGKMSGHEKIEEILRRITHFSHTMGVLVFLVAHPFKMKKDEKTGIYEMPDFYSVKGSSAFFEMSYHGMVVYRDSAIVTVKILKVKQNNLGTAGECAYFMYDKPSGRYIPSDEEAIEKVGDHRAKDWLEKALELIENKVTKQNN